MNFSGQAANDSLRKMYELRTAGTVGPCHSGNRGSNPLGSAIFGYKILINKYFYLVVITLDIILIKLKCRTGANLHDTRTDRRAFTSPAIACLYEYTFYPAQHV